MRRFLAASVLAVALPIASSAAAAAAEPGETGRDAEDVVVLTGNAGLVLNGSKRIVPTGGAPIDPSFSSTAMVRRPLAMTEPVPRIEYVPNSVTRMPSR